MKMPQKNKKSVLRPRREYYFGENKFGKLVISLLVEMIND
jgi:hypothetical protein